MSQWLHDIILSSSEDISLPPLRHFAERNETVSTGDTAISHHTEAP